LRVSTYGNLHGSLDAFLAEQKRKLDTTHPQQTLFPLPSALRRSWCVCQMAHMPPGNKNTSSSVMLGTPLVLGPSTAMQPSTSVLLSAAVGEPPFEQPPSRTNTPAILSLNDLFASAAAFWCKFRA
jgi:hypothetical protein